MENNKVTVDLEEYISLRQQSEELENILILIFANSKYTKTIDENKLYFTSDTNLMDYLKIVESYKYKTRLENLKKEEE